MAGNRWLASVRAAHTRAMGAPQNFPLFGDGRHTRGVLDQPDSNPEIAGAALAEARYRDWDHARRTGAVETTAHATAAYAPPALTLSPEDRPAVQTRIILPRLQSSTAVFGTPETELARARAILAGLVEEFGDVFPEELAAAREFLSYQKEPNR